MKSLVWLWSLVAVATSQAPVFDNMGFPQTTVNNNDNIVNNNATQTNATTQGQASPVAGVVGGETPVNGAVPGLADQQEGYASPFGQPAAGYGAQSATVPPPAVQPAGGIPLGLPPNQTNLPGQAQPAYPNPVFPEQVLTTAAPNRTVASQNASSEDANGTMLNATLVSAPTHATTTTAPPSNSWWKAFANLFGGGNKNGDDDDYYDDDYYDDDYYDDYGNGTATNNTDQYIDQWLSELSKTTTVNPMIADGSAATAVTQSGFPSISTTGTTTASPCPLSAVTLGASCSYIASPPTAEDRDLTLADISRIIFDEAIVNDLILACAPGQWCLKDSRFFTPLKSDGFEYFCNYTDCLFDSAGQCNTEERTIVTSSLSALCSMSRLNASSTCSSRVKMLLHVALADLRRSNLRGGTEDVCGMQIESASCGAGRESCVAVAESFSCLADECMTEELRSVWSNIPFWQWYFWDPDYVRGVCKIDNSTDCQFVLPSPQNEQYVFFVDMDKMDTKMMTAVATALVVALAGFIVAVWACVKRFSGGYTRDKVQYAEIRDHNFDSV